MSFDTEKLIRKFSEEPKQVSESSHYKGRPITEPESNFVQPDSKETCFEKYLTESLDSSWQNGRIYGQGEIRLRILEAVNKNLDITVVEILKILNEKI